MKKSSKGEAVLSPCQITATRLNKLEYRRLERKITLLEHDLNEGIARLKRQAQGLRYHYKNVVRVTKQNKSYQHWKSLHADEIAQDEAQSWIETLKRNERLLIKPRQNGTQSEIVTSEPIRPLLVLLEPAVDKQAETLVDFSNSFLRPQTAPDKKKLGKQTRINPLLLMLDGDKVNSVQTPPLESSSSSLLPPVTPTSARKLVQGNLVKTHRKTDLDALYRIALQNQTAYKPVEQTRIHERKLHDKVFASQHRALRGSVRSVSIVK